MRLSLYSTPNIAARVIVEDHLSTMGVEYSFEHSGEIITRNFSESRRSKLNEALARYGIELIEHEPNDLAEQIKRTIIEMVSEGENLPVNISDYLSKKLNYSYGHLTAVFSESTYTSIAHFTILQKIERIKSMLLEDDLNLTEISYRMNYSSVAYLSNQFKMVTGLTPTRFKEIMLKKQKAVAA
jgi:AraC-like DNA-binding protein